MRQGKIYEGNALLLEAFQNAVLENGRPVCEACLFELLTESVRSNVQPSQNVYQGNSVVMNKPLHGDKRKYKIYLLDPRNAKVRKIDFGSVDLSKNQQTTRKFRTIHKCGDSRDPDSHWSCLE